MDETHKLLKITKTNYTKDEKHTPSKIQADTLFNFNTKLEYIIQAIKLKMLSPRYCKEDISYLKISGIKEIAYPMKCFCDINLHKLEDHLDWYGYYGLAFSKEWGMKNKIQPVQYINPDSYLREDFSLAFNTALKEKIENDDVNILNNFIFHEMMYYKPYEGRIINRNTGKRKRKCFTDECEWRYIPDVSKLGYKQAYYNRSVLNSGGINKVNDSMCGKKEISLNFEYDEIKYIIVKTIEDFSETARIIRALNLESQSIDSLLSKIIIWDNSKGDF